MTVVRQPECGEAIIFTALVDTTGRALTVARGWQLEPSTAKCRLRTDLLTQNETNPTIRKRCPGRLFERT